MALYPYLLLSAVIFVIGMLGFLLRRNLLIMLMSVEMMLNAVNLTFVAFARMLGQTDGHVFVFLAMALAACEVALGLAIVMMVFRQARTVDVDDFRLLKG